MTAPPGWDRETSPYHSGEQELQARLNRRQRQEDLGRRLHRPYLLEQHRSFFAQLPFVAAGSVDDHGWPWASFLFGNPGFVSSPDDRTLVIESEPVVGDPLAANLAERRPLGLLGIELSTRRRNRANGVIREHGARRIVVEVVQSYGNCPQYIQTRELVPIGPGPGPIQSLSGLDSELERVIRRADTFFVASYNDREDIRDTGGVDLSHRGGQPGFIKVEGRTLTVPDFPGNNAFNTLGNFLVTPRAGLLFADFDSGDLWQLTGRVELQWEPESAARAFAGAERSWRFHLDHGWYLPGASPLRGPLLEMSPRTLKTGTW